MKRLSGIVSCGLVAWLYGMAACGGSATVERDPDPLVCRYDNDCVLTPVACCGPCEPYDASAVTAINRSHSVDYRAQHCPSNGNCAACTPVTALEATGKFLRAECQAGRCATVDVRTTPITECTAPSDCMLRDGVDCCADCDHLNWVAVSKNAEFCSGQSVPCPKCTSVPSTYMGSGCNVTTGRCEYGELR